MPDNDQHNDRPLNKSLIAAFEQCPRRLWLETFATAPALAGSSQQRFKVGQNVGAFARGLVDGYYVATPHVDQALAKTAELIAQADKAIFEAAFVHDGVLVRVDIMVPERQTSGVAWHIYEVKGSTSVKPYYVPDLATQLWVIEANGLTISSASIRHLNSKFTLEQYDQYEGLFVDADQQAPANAIAQNRAGLVAQAKAVLGTSEPICTTGAHCRNPHECSFIEHCQSTEPAGPQWPITDLPQTGARLADKWAGQGVYDICDLPDDAGLNEQHERIRLAVKTGVPHHDHTGFAEQFAKCVYPYIWLDFETIAFAIPRWLGTRPFEQIPFQFSAHVEQANGHVDHMEALDLSGDDPCEQLAAALAKLPSEGTVFAWYKSAEATSLKTLAKRAPKHAEALHSLAARLVDPMVLTKAHYYHPLQRGSYSIKYVLPTLLPELSYDRLAIGDGMMAQAAYMEAIEPGCHPVRKAEIEKQLREYCGQDTWAMKLVCFKLSVPATH
jgi:Domain of unknown function(DUF2779)